MSPRFKRLTSPSMLVAILALIVASAGSATAATLITGKQIKNSSITGADVKNSSLTGGDVKDGSVGASDLSDAAKTSGPQGTQGPKGDTGLQGPKGDTGGPGLTGLERVTANSARNSNAEKSVSVSCPSGKRAIGGGADFMGTAFVTISPLLPPFPLPQENAGPITLSASSPTGSPPSGWLAKAKEHDAFTEDWNLTGYVLCATVG